MNKIKNLFVIILFALVAFSCSDILDKGPLDKYSENGKVIKPVECVAEY